MRASGLQGVTRRRRVSTTQSDRQATVAPDRVERCFEASEPNRLWVADITYVPTVEGFLYLATVLDVFSRKVVGWAMSARQTAALVLEALQMAIDTRAPRKVVFHSDHGTQYTALAVAARCDQADILRSMGTVGDCYDNALAESLFATVECELLQRVRLTNREEAKTEIFRFLEASTTAAGATRRWATWLPWNSSVPGARRAWPQRSEGQPPPPRSFWRHRGIYRQAGWAKRAPGQQPDAPRAICR